MLALQFHLILNHLHMSILSLQQVHWLPVTYRLQFKVTTLTFNALNGTGPDYFKDLLSIKTSSYCTRSVSRSDLFVPRYSKLGERTFSFTAPKLWNSKPVDIFTCNNLLTFKKMLKLIFMVFVLGITFNSALFVF